MSFFVYIHLFTPVIRSDHWSEKVCLLKWKDLTTGVVRLYFHNKNYFGALRYKYIAIIV